MATRLLCSLLLLVSLTLPLRAQTSGDGTVPLRQLPGNGMIVVTPDLKKALDALGAGSIVLSAERYEELMRQAEKRGVEKTVPETLFAKCQITGQVISSGGREWVELTFTLDFRTETPNTVVPVPFKGIRLSKATLNGKPPPWGPDAEKWALHLSEAGSYQLALTTLLPVQRNGAERKLTLTRIPSSAITSLDVTIPGLVNNPVITGYGSVPVQKGTQPDTHLITAPALGILTSLELIWQAGASGTTATPPTLEGDLRLTLDGTQAEMEARLRPVPFAPIQLPWKIRVPIGSQQVRAELLRSEGMNSEPLVATVQPDGSYLLNSPYPLVPLGYTQLLIRWQQKLPTDGTTQLGSLELLEPKGLEQTGILTLNLPDDPVVMLKPRELTYLERNPLDVQRDPRRQRRYRYTRQPAVLEAIALPATQTRGVVEARLQHTLLAQKDGWQLVSELQVQRAVRANVQQLLFQWPAEWAVNRKVLFTPEVKDIEQDTKNETLRILLDGRQSESFTLRLDSVSAEASSSIQCRLPRLLSATSQRDSQSSPVEMLLSSETLKVEPTGVELEVKESSQGLRETGDAPRQPDRPRQFTVSQHPALLRVSRQPKLPKYTSAAKVFLGRDQSLARQTMTFPQTGALPRQLTLIIPATSAMPLFTLLAGTTTTQLKAQRLDDTDSAWHRYQLDWPTTSDAATLTIATEFAAVSPLIVPLAHLDEMQALLEKEVTVTCEHDATSLYRLPADQAKWKPISGSSALAFQCNSLKQYLILERQSVEASVEQQLTQVLTTISPAARGHLCETTITIREVKYGEWVATLPASSEAQVLGWSVNKQPMPARTLKQERLGEELRITLSLPPEYLGQSIELQVAWECVGGSNRLLGLSPLLRWQRASDQLALREVRWQTDGHPWLWLTNLTPLGDREYPWLPITPAGDSSYRLIPGSGATQAWIVHLPQSISLLVCSSLSLWLVMRTRSDSKWATNLLLIAVASWAVCLIVMPSFAWALLGGLLPGFLLGLVLRSLALLPTTRKQPVVFQSTLQTIPLPVSRSPVGEAATIISTERT